MPIKKVPLIEKCFQCRRVITVKFVPPLKKYAEKNNWGYWTEKEENKDKYVCWECLMNFYYKNHLEFLEEVKNEKKLKLLRVYFSVINNRL